MADKARKSVLVVDDETKWHEILSFNFRLCNRDASCPYEFDVEATTSGTECLVLMRDKKNKGCWPDIVVLDVDMEHPRSGLQVALASSAQFSSETPVRILFTGFPSYADCVFAMRHGAWDYFVKEDIGNKPAAQLVVESAVARLRQLDVRRDQQRIIAEDWLPCNIRLLQKDLGGSFIALWHLPEPKVIADGHDAFALEEKLRDWRSHRPVWEQPFIVQLPHLAEES